MATRTLNAVVEVLSHWTRSHPGSEAAAGAVLDLLGIAWDEEDSSTLVESVNGTFGLAYEASTMSQTAGPRVKFITSPDAHHNVTAYVRRDGFVEVRTEGMGYGMIIRPGATNTATIAVEVSR